MPSTFFGKKFCLTYARCPLSPEEILEHLQSLGDLVYYLIGREHHEDGGLHLHCAVKYGDQIRGGARLFDVGLYHPKIEAPRNFEAWKNYCRKEGFQVLETETSFSHTRGDLMSLVKTMTEGNWMEYCIEQKITFQYCRWYWDRYCNDFSTISDDTEIVGTLSTALRAMVYEPGTRALIVRGPSGCGKTTWAKQVCVKPALFVSHLDQLKKFRAGYHKSIIFDDISVQHIPREAQIHLLDFENPRAIHCRHAVATIPAGVYKIFTCNEWPVLRGDEAIERRIKPVDVRLLHNAMNQ